MDFNRPMQKNLNIEQPTECENLNDHQLKALAWLKWRESKKSIKIGIFVDDMNLGKIAMMTALVLSATNTPNKGTLVICPSTTSLKDWVKGVKYICEEGQLNVLAYNNEANAETMIAERITAEGITAEFTTKTFVITTYSTLLENLNCFKRKKCMKNNKKVTEQITWSRIILDDVHKCANRAEVKEAVFELDTGMRWCVTGTSVQDENIFNFLEFLIKPFNNAEMWSTCINSTNEHGKDVFHKIMESLVLRLMNKDVNDLKKIIELLKSKALEVIKFADIADDLVNDDHNASLFMRPFNDMSLDE